MFCHGRLEWSERYSHDPALSSVFGLSNILHNAHLVPRVRLAAPPLDLYAFVVS